MVKTTLARVHHLRSRSLLLVAAMLFSISICNSKIQNSNERPRLLQGVCSGSEYQFYCTQARQSSTGYQLSETERVSRLSSIDLSPFDTFTTRLMDMVKVSKEEYYSQTSKLLSSVPQFVSNCILAGIVLLLLIGYLGCLCANLFCAPRCTKDKEWEDILLLDGEIHADINDGRIDRQKMRYKIEALSKKVEAWEKREARKRMLRKLANFICAIITFLLIVALIVVTIYWAINVYSAGKKVAPIYCNMATLKKAAIEGDDLWLGTAKIKTRLEVLHYVLSKMTSGNALQTPSNDLLSRNLPGVSLGISADYATLPTSSAPGEYLGSDGTTKILSPAMQTYFKTTIPTTLKEEVTSYQTVLSSLQDMATFFSQTVTPSQYDQIKANDISVLTQFQTILDSSFSSLLALGTAPSAVSLQTLNDLFPWLAIILASLCLLCMLAAILVIMGLVISLLMKAPKEPAGKSKVPLHLRGLVTAEELKIQDFLVYDIEKHILVRSDLEMKDKPIILEDFVPKVNPQYSGAAFRDSERVPMAETTYARQSPSAQPSDREKVEGLTMPPASGNRNKIENEAIEPAEIDREKEKLQIHERLETLESKFGTEVQSQDLAKNAGAVQLRCCVSALVFPFAIFSIILFALGAIYSTGAALISASCIITDKSVTDKSFFSSLNAGNVVAKTTERLVTHCLMKDADGSIQAVVGSSFSETTLALDKIVLTLLAYPALSAKPASVTVPPVGSAAVSSIDALKPMTTPDSDGNSLDLETSRVKFNQYACFNDRIFNNGGCPAGSTQSTTTDAVSDHFNEASIYCIMYTQIPSHNYVRRYAASDFCSGKPIVPGQTALSAISRMSIDYLAMVNTVSTIATNYLTKEQASLDKLKAAIPSGDQIVSNADLQTIQNTYKTGPTFIPYSTCATMRRHFIAVENSVCMHLQPALVSARNFSIALAILMAALAIMLSIIWCLYYPRIVAPLSLALPKNRRKQ